MESFATGSKGKFFDELLDAHDEPRPAAAAVVEQLRRLGRSELESRQCLADLEILTQGITFTVYDDGCNIDRPWPFDVIPRVIDASEWKTIEAGLTQRLVALNRFIDDIYNDRSVIRAGVFPIELIDGSVNYRPECRNVRPKYGAWAHISGSDVVRDSDGRIYVLEDNLRVPSGVSYMLENRAISKVAFADLFARQSVQPVDGYVDKLRELLVRLAPDGVRDPCVVVLTPGIYNAAYFEHSFLARRMGVELVEGHDLSIGDDGCVYMRTISGRERVDVIYRRIDDMFLDPAELRPDSTLGVAGLMRAWREGKVAIANAPGAGVADDKVVYAWVPDLIRYYLDEEPLMPNVPTWRCLYEGEMRFVLDNMRELVVKPANESGGYGVMIGDRASDEELAKTRAAVLANPRNWNLRPFILSGPFSYVTRGGLTRVARREGSLIVNSSQGGGSKDTWVVDTTHPMPESEFA
ncbi:MAG: circularly permuted type 2 ATP-grasp protein [Actinobacteria bacterium]|nr:MAG: circularly permuted type 2 ATP-grasp protein [Actinomycetota bacterium]